MSVTRCWIVILGMSLVVSQALAGFLEASQEFDGKNSTPISRDKRDELTGLGTVNCLLENTSEETLSKLSKPGKFIEEARLLEVGPSQYDVIFELREQSSGLIVQYTKCETAQMDGKFIPFGRYLRAFNSFKNMTFRNLNSESIFEKWSTYQVALNEEFSDRTEVSLEQIVMERASVPMKQELIDSIVGRLKCEDNKGPACFGNLRSAGVEYLSVNLGEDGFGDVRGLFWGNSYHFAKVQVGPVKLDFQYGSAQPENVRGGDASLLNVQFLLHIQKVEGKWVLSEKAPLVTKTFGWPNLPLAQGKIDVKDIFDSIIAPYLLAEGK